jgi:outer membrane protein assembly factor BamC
VCASAVLGGCSWFHLGTPDEDVYDYRKSKPRQEPLEVPPDLSQLPKDDRFALPTAANAAKPADNAAAGAAGTQGAAAPSPAAPGAAPAAAAPGSVAPPTVAPATVAPGAVAPAAVAPAAVMPPAVAPAPATQVAVATPAPAVSPPAVDARFVTQAAPAGVAVSPSSPNARIERDGDVRWLAVDVSPELAYATIKDLWAGLGYRIKRDEPLVGVVETDWIEVHDEIQEDALRNSLHKAFGAFDSNGVRSRFRARIERTASDTSIITITHLTMVEIVTGVFHDSTKWQRGPGDPQLEGEMLQRLALRFAPVQPVRVAVASSGSGTAYAAGVGTAGATAGVSAPAATAGVAAPAAGAAAAASAGQDRVHKVSSGGAVTLQVEDSIDRTYRMVGVALDRGGFTVEDRRRDQHVFAVRYLDPDYEASEREKKGWWDRLFNSDAKIPEQRFLIALSASGAMTVVEVQDKDGRPDNSDTSRRIIDQLLEQMR